MQLDKSLKIGVLQGGFSKEKQVSLKTAKAIIQTLKENGYSQVIPVDVKNGFVENLINMNVDLVFNALHGHYGEDGTVQGLLESLNLPYTGAGVEASSLCMNKHVSKVLMEHAGVSTPRFFYVEKNELMGEVMKKAKSIGFPLVIKPCHEGSTYGLKIVESIEDFENSYQWCLDFGDVFILEQYIKGQEITVAVLNGQCLPSIEIIPKSGFYDYEAKYTEGKTEFICPAKLSSDLQIQAEEAAHRCAQILGVLDFCRVDMMVEDEKVYVLELNTLPGMTPTSLFPRAAKAAGISFFDLLQALITQALKRKVKA